MNQYYIKDLTKMDIPLLNSIKPDNWSSISEVHEHYLRTTNCKCIKVVNDDNEMLGIGTSIAFNGTGWLAHIIVSKNFQRQGLGSLIVNNRIDFLRDQCRCRTITLTATDQGYPVYKRIGFIEESMYYILTKPQKLKSVNKGERNIVRINQDHYDELLHIDRIVSGEDRINLLLPILQNTYVYLDKEKVAGYYLPGFGDSGVISINEAAGIALLGERIKEDKMIFIPEENDIGYKHLIANGYEEVKKIHRMILGNRFPHKLQYCYSRIGGFAG